MEIYDYKTTGGKNLITDYIESLPKPKSRNLKKLSKEQRVKDC